MMIQRGKLKIACAFFMLAVFLFTLQFILWGPCFGSGGTVKSGLLAGAVTDGVLGFILTIAFLFVEGVRELDGKP